MLLFFSLLSSIYLCQLHFQMLRFRASRLDVAQEWLGSGNICQWCFSHTHSSLIISIFKFILSQRNKPDNKKLPDLSGRQIRQLLWQRRKDSPSLRLGSTAVATCHRHVAKSRLSSPLKEKKIQISAFAGIWILVLQRGLEPRTPALKGRCSTC